MNKPSTKQQWHERSDRPVAAKYMTGTEIEYFKKVLLMSYKCVDPKDIEYYFEKILDENDEDRDDCLLLIYKMKQTGRDGNVSFRPIYRTKVPIPEHMRAKFEELRRQMFDSGNSLEAPAAPQRLAIESIPAAPAPIIDRPKLRRAIRKAR